MAKFNNDIDTIRALIDECIYTGNSEIIVQLIARLQEEYYEIAYVGTMGAYSTDTWTHKDVLNFITYQT